MFLKGFSQDGDITAQIAPTPEQQAEIAALVASPSTAAPSAGTGLVEYYFPTAVAPSTIGGISSKYLLMGAAVLGGIIMMSKKKKRR